MKDPWRYRCVECGSTRITKRNTYDNWKPGIEPESRYHCQECGEHSDTKKDMKTGGLVA